MHLSSIGSALLALSVLLFTAIASARPHAARDTNQALRHLIRSELDFLAKVPDRRTGSPGHNLLINHIQKDLQGLGLKVHHDTWFFDYNDSPTSRPELIVGGERVHIPSPVAYSGNTGPEGVTGRLVNLIGPNLVPNWAEASGGIAVVNITNFPADRRTTVPLWPGSPEWAPSYVQIPASVANVIAQNLTNAAQAGVKGIVYVWEHVTSRLARGQYGPFWTGYQDIPAVFASPLATEAIIDAANKKEKAKLTLTGALIPNHPTRNLWVIFPGTEQPEESIIINTHTDGVNIGEENGHIALQAYARSLVKHPPRRTTILAFITAHIHSAPFSYATHRSTTRWLAEHTSFWNGTSPDNLTAVFGSCVEHLGLLEFSEDLEQNTYKLTSKPADEALFAANAELAALTFDEWRGADPNVIRVSNPLVHGVLSQGGEGLPFLLDGIPEISLVTAPGWLLKEFAHGRHGKPGVDERTLIDYGAVFRQVESFERIWRRVDKLPTQDLGTVPATGSSSGRLALEKQRS